MPSRPPGRTAEPWTSFGRLGSAVWTVVELFTWTFVFLFSGNTASHYSDCHARRSSRSGIPGTPWDTYRHVSFSERRIANSRGNSD